MSASMPLRTSDPADVVITANVAIRHRSSSMMPNPLRAGDAYAPAHPMAQRTTRSRRGITMIEVLVVVAVIAVTSAMWLAAVSDVRDAARSATCQQNLRQSHLAIVMFSSQRPTGQLPTGEWAMAVIGIVPSLGSYRGDAFGASPSELIPFGMTEKVVSCPAVHDGYQGQRQSTWYYGWPAGWGGGGMDYIYRGGHGNHSVGWNGWIYGQSGYFLTTTMTLGPDREPAPPSEVLYMSDIAYNDSLTYAAWYYGSRQDLLADVMDPSNHFARGRPPWQADFSNRLYADGHLETYTLEKRYRDREGRPPGRSYDRNNWCSDYYSGYW